MYGLVNQAIKDMVVGQFGEQKWKSICTELEVPENDFVSMQYYPDQLTYKIVGVAERQLGLAASDILFEFGKYWVLYTARKGYGPLMDLFGGDYRSCLQGLNNLHARMGMSMPELSPPRFVFSEVDPKNYRVEYESKRSGLEPMVKGLLIGLATKYGVEVEIQLRIEDARRIFEVKILG